MNFNPYLPPYTKINSTWILHLNVISKIIKFLEKNIGKNICGLWLGKAFLGMKPKAQPIKEQIQLHQN